MDRLVCGDVGFGKTEVALRAASSPPTAAIRWRCWCRPPCSRSSTSRPSPTASPTGPSRSRSCRAFAPPKNKVTLDGLATGTLDIVVGTHRLLQPGVQFKDLGLLIIDEEHRFGVRHKER